MAKQFTRHSAKRQSHGLSNLPEYAVWGGMIARCYKPKCSSYRNYGGRGIEVCNAWRQSFLEFLRDMGLRPTPSHTIHRLDNDQGYYKGNVTWESDNLIQQNNKTTNRLVTLDGQALTVSEWARKTGISKSSIGDRLDRGWSAKKALSTKNYRDPPKRLITWQGETKTLEDWATPLGMTKTGLRSRLNNGVPLRKALTTPKIKLCGKRDKNISSMR